jgi:hypothetical protein
MWAHDIDTAAYGTRLAELGARRLRYAQDQNHTQIQTKSHTQGHTQGHAQDHDVAMQEN